MVKLDSHAVFSFFFTDNDVFHSIKKTDIICGIDFGQQTNK